MRLEEGKMYRLHHVRKGVLHVTIKKLDGEWADVEFTEAHTLLRMHGTWSVAAGDTIRIRLTLVDDIDELIQGESK